MFIISCKNIEPGQIYLDKPLAILPVRVNLRGSNLHGGQEDESCCVQERPVNHDVDKQGVEGAGVGQEKQTARDDKCARWDGQG